ncbi:MAG: uroporphyrinogen-III synthase [Anaerolineales bacterium]
MKVLVTRPRAQSAAFGEALQQAGFEPVYFPVIEIRPADDFSELDKALADIERYIWVVFTSVNAVDVVFDRVAVVDAKHASSLLDNAKIAAVGQKTAEALRRYGMEPDFMPDEFVGEAILPGLGDVRGKRILLPRAELARDALPKAIGTAGGIAHEIVIYRTLPAQVDAEGLAALKARVDWVTFTSPSTVQNFVQICRQNGLDPFNLPGNPKIACIGPITEKTAIAEGFDVDSVAAEYTTDGLIEAIRKRRPDVERT